MCQMDTVHQCKLMNASRVKDLFLHSFRQKIEIIVEIHL